MANLMLDPAPDITVQRLLHSPKLPFYIRQFQSLLDAEQEKRIRFYEEMSEEQKVEFINGKVVVHSPVKLRHSDASESVFILVSTFVKKYDLGKVGHEKLLITLTRNDYEPDICFFRQEHAREFAPEQMKFPPPDFIVEVLSPSTEEYDRGIKFEDYAAHGVTEYWIVDPDKQTIEQYILGDTGVYELSVKVKTGTIQSLTVEGLEIPVRAIFDEAEHLQALQVILE